MTMQEAQFTDKRVHLFKEVSETAGTTYCGLHERWEIWHRPEHADTCRQCQRFARATAAAPLKQLHDETVRQRRNDIKQGRDYL